MKKRIISFGILSILIPSLLCGCSSNSKLKLGAVLPYEGSDAAMGGSAQSGIELAIEEYNSRGKPLKSIQFTRYNGGSETRKSQAAAKNIIDDGKADIIIGGLTTDEALGIAPIVANNSKVIYVSTTASSPYITDAGQNIFALLPNESFQAESMAKFAVKNLKMNRISIIANIDDRTSYDVANSFREAFSSLKGEVPHFFGYKSTDTNFTDIIQKISISKPDALFFADFDTIKVNSLIAQAYSQGIKAKYLSTNAIQNAVLSTDPSYYEDIYCPTLFSLASTSSSLQSFVRNYQVKYDRMPDMYAAYAYDATKMIIEAVNKAGGATNTIDILGALTSSQYGAVTGDFKFDNHRRAIKTLLITRIKEGRPYLFTSFEP